MRAVKRKPQKKAGVKKNTPARSKSIRFVLRSSFLKVFLSTVLLTSFAAFTYFKAGPFAIEKTQEAFVKTTSFLGFKASDIIIEGREFTSKELLDETLITVYGKSIFSQRLKDIRLSLETIPWIDKVEVQRFLPGRLRISIHERVPIAVWQHEKKFYLVDQEGVVIQFTNFIPNPALPLVVGEDAPQAISKLVQLFRPFPDILKEIEYLRFISKRRWNIILKNKVVVLLPQEDLSKAIVLLSAVLKDGQANRDDLDQIDLRIKDKVGLKFKSLQKIQNHKKEKEA
ncbi:MAG TPA: cell division protein FtsQ/DivIB [Alphaproteobacteria bacterium]|nr:cell division protein FtsQ/DivIB [Alphaproteobacteria bacterium]